MMTYPKINSLWKRRGDHSFIEGDYSLEEFSSIKRWRVEEKIDGTNIRINVSAYPVVVSGRNNDSGVPGKLLEYVTTHFTADRIKELHNLIKTPDLTFFGEGYGPKIQNGGNYRDTVGFILFDAWSGSRWSTREEVRELALLLQLPTPHDYGLMTEDEIVALVKSKPQSPSAIRPYTLEGVICRTSPLVRSNSSGDPIVFKLKCKEFEGIVTELLDRLTK